MKAAILHSADSVPGLRRLRRAGGRPGQPDRGAGGRGHPPAHPVGGGRPPLRPRRGLPGHPRPQRGGAHGGRRAGLHLLRPPPYGTFAERIASPDAMRFPLPDGAPARGRRRGRQPGHGVLAAAEGPPGRGGTLGTVLVLGITGMSGFLAAQNARLLGATRVVGAGRSQPGLDRAAAAGANRRPHRRPGTDAEALATVLDGDHPAWCSTSYGDPSPRPPSGPRPGGASARTRPTSTTSRSARWPGPRPPSRPHCCAAGS